MDDNRLKLETLRISVARLAQHVGADNHLEIAESDYTALSYKAKAYESGWNDLVGLCIDALEAQAQLDFEQRVRPPSAPVLAPNILAPGVTIEASATKLTSDQRQELICALAGRMVASPTTVLECFMYGRFGLVGYSDEDLLLAAEIWGVPVKLTVEKGTEGETS